MHIPALVRSNRSLQGRLRLGDMYLSHYHLHHMPFQISSDPRFLWLGEKHKEALAVLKYGVLNNQGFLLLTGDVGTGKTTLINALVNSLGLRHVCHQCHRSSSR